jgi:Tetracyclin repressor-like, C-terminal domain
VLICFFITHQWEKKEEAFIISSEVRSLTPENYQVIKALGDAFRDRVEEIIRKGMTAGKFRVKNATVAAIAVCDILGGPARWYYPKELLVLDEIMEMITDMIFQLLGMPQTAEKQPLHRVEAPARPAIEAGSRLSAAGQATAAAVEFPRARLWVR